MRCLRIAPAVLLLLLGVSVLAAPPGREVLKLSDAEKARLPEAARLEAVQRYGLRAMALSNDFVARHSDRYSCVVPGTGRIRDQHQTGRCWIYATDRVLRSIALARGVGQVPPMSTSFVNYHALRKLAVGVLERAARGDRKGLDPDAVGDASEGGYQPWALEIIREKGFVPRSIQGSSADGASSALAVNQLQRLVAAGQQELGAVKRSPGAVEQRRAILARYTREVDALLDATLGAPPKSFRYRGKSYTPESFLKDYLRLAAADLDLVVLGHNPTKAFSRSRAIKDPGMQPFRVYNVAMPVLQKAVRDTLERGEAVYVATNVSPNQPFRAEGKNIPARAKGILSVGAFRYESFIPQHRLSKHDRIDADISISNHAMAITGFDADGAKVRKWRIENSWGRDAGAGGHWHMYDDFFREYVTEVAVPRALVPKAILEKADARAKSSAKKKKGS
jgi:bleomycin hydrolase